MRMTETYERQKSFYEKSKVLQHLMPEVLVWTKGDGKSPIDMIAVEVQFHDDCMKNFTSISDSPQTYELYHEKFCDLIKDIDNELTEGKVPLSSVLRNCY